MERAAATRQQLLYAVSWEAALSFSLATWGLAADSAWPANRPFRFVAAVLSGATATLLLCHILPAWIFRELRLPKHRAVTVLKWAAIIWYSAGAMASFCWLVQAEGQTLFLGRFDEKALSTLAAVVIALLGLLVLRAGPAGQQKIALLFFMFCLGVVLLCLVTQIGGLWIRNKGYEQYLGQNFSVFQGMLLAGAPATIFAIRMGTANPSRRAIVWTGLCGLWLPMVCSVSLVSVAAMCGARLYQQGSVPIGVAFAFVWIARTLLKDLRSVFLLMTFIPMVTLALWIRYLTEELGWTWKRWVVLLVIGAFGFDLLRMAEDDLSLLQGYYLPWCWSILCGAPLLGVCLIAARAWQRFRSDRTIGAFSRATFIRR